MTGMLPIGTVVLLKNSTKKVMIIGFCQQEPDKNPPVVWDYAGSLYPEGYMGPNQTYMFNHDQIDKIFAIGYQDEEQFTFKVKLDAIAERLRKDGPEGL